VHGHHEEERDVELERDGQEGEARGDAGELRGDDAGRGVADAQDREEENEERDVERGEEGERDDDLRSLVGGWNKLFFYLYLMLYTCLQHSMG
jgi:hypothetical protein